MAKISRWSIKIALFLAKIFRWWIKTALFCKTLQMINQSGIFLQSISWLWIKTALFLQSISWLWIETCHQQSRFCPHNDFAQTNWLIRISEEIFWHMYWQFWDDKGIKLKLIDWFEYEKTFFGTHIGHFGRMMALPLSHKVILDNS